MRTTSIALFMLAFFGLASCADGGGGGHARRGHAAPGASGGRAPGSATNKAQWQTALAALAGPSPDPVAIEPASVAVYNGLFARNWPHLVPMIESVASAEIRAAAGRAFGPLSILSISAVSLDCSAPPALAASPPGSRQTLDLLFPAPPGKWSLTVSATIGGTIPFSFGGFTTSAAIQAGIDVRVSDIEIDQPIVMDLSNPVNPVIVSAGAPAIDLRIAISSQDPIVSTIAGTLTQLLDPLVRAALIAGSAIAEQQLGLLLAALPQGAYWGVGGPGPQPVPSPPPFEPLAEGIDDEIERNHMAMGQVFPAVFDRPNQGGNRVQFRHFGDSGNWTGVYLAAQAYRWDLVGDRRALRSARRVMEALELLTRLAGPNLGLLVRCALPVSSPLAAPIFGDPASFTGTWNGETYIGIGDPSRDTYTGVFFGLGLAWQRIPSERANAARIAGRLLAHLEARDWAVYQAPGQLNSSPSGPGLSVTFVQAPGGILLLSKIGALSDPARWGALHDSYKPLADLLWFNSWFSAREIHESYYKFDLEHTILVTLFELETDPALYRAYLRDLRILREALGHHQNAWFDTVYALALPPVAAAIGPQIEIELARWTLRPRRGFTILNSQDPSIAKTTYTTSLPNAGGAPNTGYTTGTRTIEVALFPLPIEKRPSTAFLWSSSPFELDGSVDPHEQHPGIDFILPYWVAQNHGIIR